MVFLWIFWCCGGNPLSCSKNAAVSPAFAAQSPEFPTAIDLCRSGHLQTCRPSDFWLIPWKFGVLGVLGFYTTGWAVETANPNLSPIESWLNFIGIPLLDYEIIPNDYWVVSSTILINQQRFWTLLIWLFRSVKSSLTWVRNLDHGIDWIIVDESFPFGSHFDP